MILLELIRIASKIDIDTSEDTIKISNILFLRSSVNDYFYRIFKLNDILYKMTIDKDQISLIEYYNSIMFYKDNALSFPFSDLDQDDSYLVLKYGKILLEKI